MNFGPASVDFGIPIYPRFAGALDARTAGLANNRPTPANTGKGLLRVEFDTTTDTATPSLKVWTGARWATLMPRIPIDSTDKDTYLTTTAAGDSVYSDVIRPLQIKPHRTYQGGADGNVGLGGVTTIEDTQVGTTLNFAEATNLIKYINVEYMLIPAMAPTDGNNYVVRSTGTNSTWTGCAWQSNDINFLNDVNINAPQVQDVLLWNGSRWVNSTLPTRNYATGKLNSNQSVAPNTHTTLPFVHHIGVNNWNSNSYTVPTTGDYKVTVSIGVTSLTNDALYQFYAELRKNTTNIFNTSHNAATASGEDDYENTSVSFATVESFSANDNISVRVYQLSQLSNLTALVVSSQTRIIIEQMS